MTSASWVRALSGAGPDRDEAVERLHALLLCAAAVEVARRRASADGAGGYLDDLAGQAADEALMAVLSKLHTYRGASRFTTWACKFALLEAAAAMRRRSWHGRELPLEIEGWARLPDDVRDAIGEVLTPHQRGVLLALTVNDVPIDVLAERHGTTRHALYETLHDGRRKLRARLAEDGLVVASS